LRVGPCLPVDYLDPALYAVRMLKTIENGTDYSVQNTARQALYLPTSREA